ncbi:hypothetical protein [Actinomyces sp. 565]|uniref:hypothetical protein n=1 Tax=Actinomyces sp. 565 TaxID=2057794 RepID=UPI0013A6F1FF|nr:hypothetical protein [Actinomyces sp. 565]NDR54686.1 hypothetical protein [Actinomyces sp. 565]
MRSRTIHALLAAVLALASALLINGNSYAQQVAINQGSRAGSPSAGVSSSGDGGGSIEASVTVAYTSPGSTPASQTVTSSAQVVQVPPSCGYKPTYTGPEIAAIYRQEPESFRSAPEDAPGLKPLYSDWEDHAEDTSGKWWRSYCNPSVFPDSQSFVKAQHEFNSNNPTVIWVATDDSPPAPHIDPATLATTVWEGASIPAPTIDYNPKVGSRQATVVGFATWIWTTNNTPRRVQIQATAGSTSVTVTAASTRLDLSAPDSEVDCTGFGIPWTQSNDHLGTNCMIMFTRSSAHLQDSVTPLDASISYTATWTSTTGQAGTLNPLTTTTTTTIPVAEIQTLNTRPTKQP